MPNPDPTPTATNPPRRGLLWAEMITLFFALPGAVALFVDPERRLDAFLAGMGIEIGNLGFPRFRVLLPLLAVFTVVIAVVLVLSRSFPTRQLWNWAAFKRELPRIFLTFVLGAAGLLGVAYLLHAHTDVLTITTRSGETGTAFLRLPREAPEILVLIAVGYPWFSAYPQEITHRAFFFHRYRAILPGRWSMIGVNALAFMWLHAPFWNWMALVLTLPGGVLFAWTYGRTKSTLAAGMEHALFGWWIFFTGLGWFVYAGSLGS